MVEHIGHAWLQTTLPVGVCGQQGLPSQAHASPSQLPPAFAVPQFNSDLDFYAQVVVTQLYLWGPEQHAPNGMGHIMQGLYHARGSRSNVCKGTSDTRTCFHIPRYVPVGTRTTCTKRQGLHHARGSRSSVCKGIFDTRTSFHNLRYEVAIHTVYQRTGN
jgi:hypothetical protein